MLKLTKQKKTFVLKRVFFLCSSAHGCKMSSAKRGMLRTAAVPRSWGRAGSFLPLAVQA